MTGLTLTEREFAALRTVVDPAHTDGPDEGLSWTLLQAIADLVGADDVVLDQVDPDARWFVVWQSLAEHVCGENVDDPGDHFWDLWQRSPAKIYARAGAAELTQIRTLSDYVSDRRWRADPLFDYNVRESGLFHEIGVNLLDPRSRPVRLHCWRTPGRDFGERERFYLTLLRPHLIAPVTAALAQPAPAVALTPRQRQLLDLVADGCTNRQAARRLGIAEGTVRRHLNDIYERLGVGSRTAAVTRAVTVLPSDPFSPPVRQI
jgi:DNA-binding CsgD family transcriptional regulator